MNRMAAPVSRNDRISAVSCLRPRFFSTFRRMIVLFIFVPSTRMRIAWRNAPPLPGSAGKDGCVEILVKAGDVRSPSPVRISFRCSRKEFDLPCFLFYHTSLSSPSQIGLRRRKTVFPGRGHPPPDSLRRTQVSISSRFCILFCVHGDGSTGTVPMYTGVACPFSFYSSPSGRCLCPPEMPSCLSG